jgi:hypothetical protein
LLKPDEESGDEANGTAAGESETEESIARLRSSGMATKKNGELICVVGGQLYRQLISLAAVLNSILFIAFKFKIFNSYFKFITRLKQT